MNLLKFTACSFLVSLLFAFVASLACYIAIILFGFILNKDSSSLNFIAFLPLVIMPVILIPSQVFIYLKRLEKFKYEKSERFSRSISGEIDLVSTVNMKSVKSDLLNVADITSFSDRNISGVFHAVKESDGSSFTHNNREFILEVDDSYSKLIYLIKPSKKYILTDFTASNFFYRNLLARLLH